MHPSLMNNVHSLAPAQQPAVVMDGSPEASLPYWQQGAQQFGEGAQSCNDDVLQTDTHTAGQAARTTETAAGCAGPLASHTASYVQLIS
jgi:hypothetical protein